MARPTRFLLCAVVALTLAAPRWAGCAGRAALQCTLVTSGLVTAIVGRRVLRIDSTAARDRTSGGSNDSAPPAAQHSRVAPSSSQPSCRSNGGAQPRPTSGSATTQGSAGGSRATNPTGGAPAPPVGGVGTARPRYGAPTQGHAAGRAPGHTRSIRTIRSIRTTRTTGIRTTAGASATAATTATTRAGTAATRATATTAAADTRTRVAGGGECVHVRDRDGIDPAACEPVERQGLRRRHAHGHRR